MNEKILNKDVRIENNMVVITKNVEVVLNKSQLESQLRDIQIRKSGLQEQNNRLVAEYNQLTIAEQDINDMIAQLSTGETIQEI